MLDGYSSEQEFAALNRYFLEKDSVTGLRDKLAFNLTHSGILRDESVRSMELADLHHTTLPHEGFTECPAVVCVLHNGKTNRFNRLVYASFTRHRDVECSTTSALAFYLLAR